MFIEANNTHSHSHTWHQYGLVCVHVIIFMRTCLVVVDTLAAVGTYFVHREPPLDSYYYDYYCQINIAD